MSVAVIITLVLLGILSLNVVISLLRANKIREIGYRLHNMFESEYSDF